MRRTRHEGLDGIRGLAALGVLLHHVWWYEDASAPVSPSFDVALADNVLGHLRLGVTVFFVLSGFLLYAPFARASLTGEAWPPLRRYALSRLLRIVPAYWLALTVVVFVLHRDLLASDPAAVLRTYLFLQIYVPTPGMIVPAWTLCLEIAFYAVLPFLAAAVHRWACGARSMRERALRHAGALALVAAVGLEYRMLRASGSVPATNLLAFVDQFVPGMLLAVAWEYRRGRGQALFHRRLAAVAVAAGVAVMVGITLAAVDHPSRVSVTNVVGVPYEFGIGCGVALLLAALLASPGGMAHRALGSTAVAGLGAVSYGLYLWHQPMLNALRDWGVLLPNQGRFFALNVILVAVPSLAVAAFSWRFVERPALALNRVRPEPESGPLAAAAAPSTS